jgi:DNA-binding NarL/FixJ family response regulator
MTSARRCLVADDHPALAAAVVSFLGEAGFEIVGPASDGEIAVALAAAEQPDVAVVDFRMPRLHGPGLVRELATAVPGMPIVVYTAEGDATMAREVLAAGAAAIVLKEAPLADLLRAVQGAVAGRSYVDAALANTTPVGVGLTQRELDVLALLAEGLQHEDIGRQLGISAETVRTHLRKACDRLGAATRTEAVATALRRGLIA